MKKVIKASILGLSVLAMASAAQAADYEINIMGASAQSGFWNTNARIFLADATGLGCTSTTVYGNKDNGATVGTNCTPAAGLGISIATSDRVIMRYIAKASIWGPMAANGDDIVDDPCGAGEFTMLDVDNCPGGVCASKCVNVTYGASDVSGEAFTQSSVGYILGPMTDGDYDSENPTSTDDYYSEGENSYSGYDASNLNYVRPVVVPFSFFVTEDVPVDNLSRLQAVLAFSGQATNWEDIGVDADGTSADTKMTICLRHAGSGTHATLDHAVMHGDASLVGVEDIDGTGGSIKWFNEGSSDLMKCMTYAGQNVWPTPTAYAIGYADSDKCSSTSAMTKAEAIALGSTWSSTCSAVTFDGYTSSNVKRIKYQGLPGDRTSIKNCMYPFWAAQYLYYDADEVNVASPVNNNDKIHKALYTYMANPAKVSGIFWATQDEMKCMKDTDFKFPTKK
jgi:ABC-type phosphate transport system substrate-binding protein